MKKKKSTGEIIFDSCNYVFMFIFSIATVYPFINILALSLNEGIDSSLGGITIFPRQFTLENYRIALGFPSIADALFISVSRTFLGMVYHLTMVTLFAFAMSKKDLLFRKVITMIVLFAVYTSPGLIPNYINMVKVLHLAPNNYLVYILPGFFSLYNYAIIRTAIENVPLSLEESAMMDGAGYLKVFFSITLPLIVPTLAALALFCAVGAWNDWMTSMLYFSKKKLWTLQYVLQQILQENSQREILSFQQLSDQNERAKETFTSTSIQNAILMITTIPIICVYPFVQKYFTKGVLVGAVKE